MELYPNYTLFIQIANFLFLLFLLNVILYRPIRKILGQRKMEIQVFEGDIGELQAKSVQYEQELEENAAGARNEGFKEKEALKGEGLEEEKGLLDVAMASAAEKVDQAKEEIGRKIGEARRSLEEEMAAFSQELAQEMLGRSL